MKPRTHRLLILAALAAVILAAALSPAAADSKALKERASSP